MSNYGISSAGIMAAWFVVWCGIAAAQAPANSGSNLADADRLAKRGAESCRMGRYSEGEHALREALAIREHILPPEDPQIAATLNDLGAAIHYQGRFGEAEVLYRRAIDLFAKTPLGGADHIASLGNLASVYREQRRMAEAGAVYADLLHRFEDPKAVNELTVATVMNDYGMFLKTKGDQDGAERAFARSAEIRERRLQPGDPALISTWTSLADLYSARGLLSRAGALFQKAVTACEASFGPTGRFCAPPLNGLGVVLMHRGAVKEAERLLTRSLAIFEESRGADHPLVAAVLNNLGTLATRTGDYKKAEHYLSRAIEIWTAQFGPNHPDVASASANLAGVYMHRRKWDQAEALYRDALKADEKCFGTYNAKVALDHNNLGAFFISAKRPDEGYLEFGRALEIYERIYGRDSLSVAGVLTNLANQRSNEKRYADAIPLYQRALEIYQEHPGAETEATAAAFENYANLMRKASEYAEARKAEAFAMRIRVREAIVRDQAQSWMGK